MLFSLLNPTNFVDPTGLSKLIIENTSGGSLAVHNPTAESLIQALNNSPDGSIAKLKIVGHGGQYAQCISSGSNCDTFITMDSKIMQGGEIFTTELTSILDQKLEKGGELMLLGCKNASGSNNIVKSISKSLPHSPVTGGSSYQFGYEDHWLFGTSSNLIGTKKTYINGVPQ